MRIGIISFIITFILIGTFLFLAEYTNNSNFYGYFGYAITIGIPISILLLIYERRTKKKQDRIKIIEGMLKLEKNVDLKIASRIIGCSLKKLRNLIMKLIGENKITGEIRGNIFILESGVDEFIAQLEEEFLTWEKLEKGKIGKKLSFQL